MKLKRLRKVGAAYYYDTCSKPRRWIPLGTDEAVAMKRYRRLLDARKPERGTVGALLDEFVDHPRPSWSAGTRAMYSVLARHLQRVFGDCDPAEVERSHVLAYLDTCERTSARAEISVLRQVMERAVRRGLCSTNPCIGARTEIPRVSRRNRLLSDDELERVIAEGRPLLKVALRLMYLTGLRPGNVILARWDDFAGGSIQQQKTAKHGPRQRYVLTPELREALDAARALQGRVGTLTVLSERGRPLHKNRLGDLWREACEAAGIEDAQLRDVRAKSASDADAEGQDAQRLLGHTSPNTTRTYLRGRRVVTVEPVKRKRG
jgi:integrase